MLTALIRFLSSRENYEKYMRFVREESVPKEAWTILQAIPKYWEAHTSTEVNYQDFYTWYALSHPGAKNLGILQALCNAIHTDGTVLNDSLIQSFIDRSYAEQIISVAEDILDGKSNGLSKYKLLLDKFKSESVKLDKVFQERKVRSGFDMLFEHARAGYDFSLPYLNTLLGTLSSEFIIVGARPDGGKTTFFVQEAVHIARQLPREKCVLWFNNEESVTKVYRRIVQNALGITAAELEKDKITALRKFQRAVGEEKIRLIDDAHEWSIVDEAIEKYSPGLIIIDQLYKVKGDTSDGLEAEVFRQKCATAREIAKHVCPVMVSNQLDGSAEDVKYPPMSCLYGSKTGAQGEADAIIFLGKNRSEPDKRFVYTPKNKLTGKTSEYFEVTLDSDKARYL